MARGEEDPLVVNQHFNYSNRPPRDVPWAVAFVLFLCATIAGGIYAIVNRSSDFKHAFDSDYLSNPAHCPVHGRDLLDEQPQLDVPDFFRHAGIWIIISSAASLLLGVVFLLIFRHHPHTMVRLTIQVQIAIPIAMGIFALLSGEIWSGFVYLGLGALAALCFYLWRNEIELCARLLGVAAQGLNDNPGLLFFIVTSKLCMTCVILPLFAFIFFSYTNGTVVPNQLRAEGVGQCIDTQGQEVYCCQWQPEPWVGAYMSLASVTFLWTIFFFGQLRVYVIGGTIAQWYFAPPGVNATKGSTLRMVRYGLGPSFGTVSFAALVLTLVQIARNAMEQARQSQDGQNIVMSLVACCLECIYSLVEYLTKFATICASITGEALIDAGRRATDILTRNFLKAYGVWWFPPLVLQCAAFLLSVAWGGGIYVASYLAWHSRATGNQEAALLGFISFFVAWVVLSFFSSVLLDIVDTCFFCYALDKDAETITKAEVHEVFAQVPVALGSAVEQPDGELMYGAPAGSAPRYVPPSHPAAATHASAPPYAAPGTVV